MQSPPPAVPGFVIVGGIRSRRTRPLCLVSCYIPWGASGMKEEQSARTPRVPACMHSFIHGKESKHTPPSTVAIASYRSVVGICLGERLGMMDRSAWLVPMLYLDDANADVDTHGGLCNVDGICLCVFFGDGMAASLLPHHRALPSS